MLLLAALMITGCRTAREAATGAPPPAHENLHAVLWVQTAAEYQALTVQTYAAAARMLDSALAVPTWTAALEQTDLAVGRDLRPAVVLDVDETVLDNSAYQARLVREGGVYERASWQAWVREEAAEAVPGALAFARYAERRDVAVVYLTNRRAEVEDATRANLARLGFPLDPDDDTVVMRGERPGWDTGDKTTRREAVADRYRIVLMIGDNIGDFIGGVDRSVEARAALVERYADYWGTRWFVLPNPQYGSWEGALFDYDYGLAPAERARRKAGRLETRQ